MWTLLLLLPAALLLDVVLGDPPNRAHPVCWMGWTARWMERAARRVLGNGFGAGALATLGVCVGVLLPVWGAFVLIELTGNDWLAYAFSVLAVYFCVAPRGLERHARRVADALDVGAGDEARRAVSMIVGRDTAPLDSAGIARAAVESVAENLTDGVLGTMFWAAAGARCLGLQGAALGALTHRLINTLDALWGKKNERYRHFGTFAARADDALNLIPARLSLPIIALAALALPRASSRRALSVGWRCRYAHASPNSAWSEAAFAGALNLRLGGPVRYGGVLAPYPWIGFGRQEAQADDIRQSIRLMWLATGCALLFISILVATLG